MQKNIRCVIFFRIKNKYGIQYGTYSRLVFNLDKTNLAFSLQFTILLMYVIQPQFLRHKIKEDLSMEASHN